MTTPANQEARLTIVESAVLRIESAIGQIADALQMISRLDAQHAATAEALGRSFKEVKSLDARVQAIEIAMPGLKETRSWVIGGILAVIGIAGAALLGLVVSTPRG